jgi:CRP-like cAMP-binding protein
MKPDPAQLANVPLFAELTPQEREELAGWTEVREVSAGQPVTLEGASGYTFFVIQSGTADVQEGEEKVRELGPGDFFGEMAILGEGRRRGTVVATSPLTVLAMFGTEFRRLEAELPELGERIRAEMQRRLAESEAS